ncbi:unnamed protein product [Malus baccata var. baccata]
MFKSCLVDSGFHRNSLFLVEKGYLRAYYATASALLTTDAHVFEENPLPVDAYVIQEIKAVRERSSIRGKQKLYPVVTRVYKSLDWEVAWDLRFSRSVKQYGFSHSLSAFSVIVHVFALAGMKMEVHSLLSDIVCYHRDAKYDAFGLFPYLFDSPHNGARTLVFDALIMTFAANSMLENAVDAFVQTKNMQLEPHIGSCNFLLKCLAEANKLESVRSLFECLRKYGPSPNVYTYTIMMNFYCQGHEGKGVDIDEATDILQEMEKSGKHPTVVIYTKYIHALCDVGWVEFALDFIRNLRCRNQPLNSYCYNAILFGFCQNGETYEALKVLEEMKTYGTLPDVYCYTILIDGLCKEGDIEIALTLFEEMERYKIKPTLVSYSSLICGLCKIGLVDDSLDIFRDLVADGVRPDAITCTLIVEGYCREGRLKEALKFMYEMHNQGINLNSYTYNAVIKSLCKERQPEKAWEFFPQMLKRNIHPEVANYNTLMNGFAKKLSTKKALIVYKGMLKVGVMPNAVTYTILINTFCHGGKMREAYNLFKEMSERGLVVDVISYTSLIAGFYRIGDMKKAWALFNEMLRNNHLPNAITYTCLIDGFCKSLRMDFASFLFDEMKRKNVIPDAVTYTVLMIGYFRLGNIDRAIQLFAEMKERGISPDVIAQETMGLYTGTLTKGLLELTVPFADWTRSTLLQPSDWHRPVLLRCERWEEKDGNSIGIAVVGFRWFLSGLKRGSNLSIVDMGWHCIYFWRTILGFGFQKQTPLATRVT